MPFVMSGKSVIHDQGRAKRLFEDALRIALNLLHPDMHHRRLHHPRRPGAKPTTRCPGPRAARPDLEDGTLLCPFHHHRAHDPAWHTTHHPNGTTTFTRRQ